MQGLNLGHIGLRLGLIAGGAMAEEGYIIHLLLEGHCGKQDFGLDEP